jgi:hypothetical protein
LDRRDSQLRFAFHVGLRAIELICKSFHRDLPLARNETAPDAVCVMCWSGLAAPAPTTVGVGAV